MSNGEQFGGGHSRDLAQQIKDLAEQCRKDREATQAQIGQLIMANDLVTVVRNGFLHLDERLATVGDIPAQLAPLRDLAPRRFQLPANISQKIAEVVGPMRRPAFGGGGLGLPEANVPFIAQGQVPQQPLPTLENFAAVMNLLRPAYAVLPLGGAANSEGQQGQQGQLSEPLQQPRNPLGGELA